MTAVKLLTDELETAHMPKTQVTGMYTARCYNLWRSYATWHAATSKVAKRLEYSQLENLHSKAVRLERLCNAKPSKSFRSMKEFRNITS